jgi:hypothetical protein
MTNLKNVTSVVQYIMENNERARNNDDYLYMKVLELYGDAKGVDIHHMTVTKFLKDRTYYSFPPFESVRRSRQKVQEKNPWLKANAETQAHRKANEQKYLEYARGN